MNIAFMRAQVIGAETWRWSACIAVLLSLAVWVGCGDVFRPVAVPVVGNPPDPANYHFAMVVSQNAPGSPSSAMQIDVSGDSNIGNAKIGVGPVHAALLPPNGGRVYVANNLDDTVSAFAPAPACLVAPCPVSSPGTVTTISLPAGSSPLFVHSTQSTRMYVANFGGVTTVGGNNVAVNNDVAVIDAQSNVVSSFIPVSGRPTALVETPNGQKLYSLNQGDSAVVPALSASVTPINTVDNSTGTPITSFTSPVWGAASSDNSAVFVLDSATGLISVIDTATDNVAAVTASTESAGPGANFMFLDRRLDRLYVTNPVANTIAIYNAAVTDVATGTPPKMMTPAPIPLPAGAANPVMVTSLQDGTNAYVVSHQVVGSVLNSEVTIIRNANNTVLGSPIRLASVNLASIPAAALATCQNPTLTRFRTSIASSVDSSKVYVSVCDAGTTYVIKTSNNTVVLPNGMTSPVSAYTPVTGLQPPPQNPVLVITSP
jgi:DNA-binding beta-propeller fold protein YncE